MAIEGENRIGKIYSEVHNRPDFTLEPALGTPEIDMTVIDTFAVPQNIVENPEKFLEWFESRFFELKSDQDFLLFSSLFRQALDVLESQPFLLSPRIGKDFPVAAKTKRKVLEGFKDLSHVLSFFRSVAIPEDAGLRKFITPDRKTSAGAEKLSACRILTTAYVLDHIRQSQDLDKFMSYSQQVLGRGKSAIGMEPGILSTLVTPTTIDILDKPNGKKDFIYWLGKSQAINGCYLNNIGSRDKKHSHYIPEVHIGLKDGFRAFLKILREPEAEFRPLDDFLRMRFVLEDTTLIENILELVNDIYREADAKKNPRAKVEVRARNYMNKAVLDDYFPEIKGKAKQEELGEEDTDVQIKEKRDGLFPLTIYENRSSGKGFKNITLKIHLQKPGSKKHYFGFEIQILTKSELIANERLESHSSHFLFEMKQAIMNMSRNNCKLRRDEIIRDLIQYMDKNISTEKMPEMLLGNAKYPEKYGSEAIEMPFLGTTSEKAEKIFDFLVTDGTLRHVAANFPSIEIPTHEQRMTSGLYVHETILTRKLDALGLTKKAKKKK
ncbi:MAG: hypothetical protein WC831_06050 [Parcubacteria group bacterium]|jgi:hypothetical protein